MNWGRGLFRLWVIFSALWIAGLSAIFIRGRDLLEANKTYDVEGRFKEKYEVVAPSNVSLRQKSSRSPSKTSEPTALRVRVGHGATTRLKFKCPVRQLTPP